MRLLVAVSLLVLSAQSHSVHRSAVIQPENDALRNRREFGFLPNIVGCEQTKACYVDLLQSVGFDADPFPTYDEYHHALTKLYNTGNGMVSFCGAFDAVSRCFSVESDSCRSPTVFGTLFNLTSDEAYRYATDLDLRKIICDNQQELDDPCMNSTDVLQSLSTSNDAAVSCDVAAISDADDSGCPDSVLSVKCQLSAKTKEIQTVGACDGKIAKCPTTFHSCDWTQSCFDTFYAGVEKLGVKTPLPDYTAYASSMKRKFENADGIVDMCGLQESLQACLVRHEDSHCPLNAASFRSMYNMNYEQAYDYSTDFTLRKTQCLNKEGVKQNSCVTKAKLLTDVCKPDIPHNLTLGKSCTDLRLAMRCNNAVIREICPEEAAQMYCQTTEIIYQQQALGFCDGWMPGCDLNSERAMPSSPKDNLNKMIGIPNLVGCEQTSACYADLLQYVGFDSFPSYDDYQLKLADEYSRGDGVAAFCGTFDAVSRCFSQESDSCRTPTIFTTLFNLTNDDAYQFAADLDLRKIMCDNVQDIDDPCLSEVAIKRSLPLSKADEETCHIDHADVTICPDSVKTLSCQFESKAKEIETLGACDGKLPKCASNFHSCDWTYKCFNDFYDGVAKAGVSSPLPDYTAFASSMKRKFENAAGIDNLCRLQESLVACLIVHVDKNCPINAASFRSMYNLNYEQAYNYATDYSLRQAQCLNKEGVKQNKCLTKAKILTDVCTPDIPKDLSLGKSCTDLRLALKCSNFGIREFCPAEAQKMYCETTGIIYQQQALGFCDGWMPGCEPEPTQRPPATDSTDIPEIKTTVEVIRTTEPVAPVETTQQPDEAHTTVEAIKTTNVPEVKTTPEGILTTEQPQVKTSASAEVTTEEIDRSTQEPVVTTARTTPAPITTTTFGLTRSSTTRRTMATTPAAVKSSTQAYFDTTTSSYEPHHGLPMLPNMVGCEKTKACYADLLKSVGYDVDSFPSYDDYQQKMINQYSSGSGLSAYCGTFDAVTHCFSQESDSCRTPTIFNSLFNLTSDDAYLYTADLDLRKIMCDNEQAMADPCLSSATKLPAIADDSCSVADADSSGCADSLKSLFCQLSSKTKEIQTLGACDGKIPNCPSTFHACDWMHSCFNKFYDGVDKAGVSSPLPDYTAYASAMKRKFENAAGIDNLCRLQENLDACLVSHMDKNCPLNAASFRSMFNMNYEQAYNYATDHNLRKTQCLNKEGVKQNVCVTKAKLLTDICTPDIPHDLSLGKACTDLRLAMKCNNFGVRQFCPEAAQQMYCQTTEIIYQQQALGFCDGWMPGCGPDEPVHVPTRPPRPPTTTTTKKVYSSTQSHPTESATQTASIRSSSNMPITTSVFERKTTTLPPKTSPTTSVPLTSLPASTATVPIPFLTSTVSPADSSTSVTAPTESTASPTTSLASSPISLATTLMISVGMIVLSL